MTSINLSGKWTMLDCESSKTYSADIPGTDVGNLIKYGNVTSPLISGNDKEGEELCDKDREFSRTFEITAEQMAFEHINLRCESLDTICTCYINSKEVFKSNNAFIPVDADIKEYLKVGENEIRLHFSSAVSYIKKRQKETPLPKNPNGIDGIPYIRKPACHFGWDWGPCVPYCGVTGNIELECYNSRIENVEIHQNTTKEKAIVTATADNAERIYIISPQGDYIEANNEGKFVILSPELWYTYELSQKEKQPLYTVVFQNKEQRLEKKIGLRSLYLDTSKDQYGSNFCLVLNGEKVFAKGGNLISFSAIYEDSSEKDVDYYLDLAQKSNFNIIRVWGGASYSNEYLLSQCDERGILIWQDFMFACQMYPFYEDDFTANVLNEVTANVKRINTHPCLALWCGNNELEVMFSYLPKTTKIMKTYEKFFYHILPEHIKDLTEASYIPTSPMGSECFKEYSSDNVGDTHMWNVWHGLKKLDYYTTRYSRFLSEFGLESLPSMKAIKTFAPPEEYDITSPSFNRHQKCVGGNKKMLFYLTEMFDFPKHFEDLPYLTGIVQAECIKNATIHFRQNKGRCNGSIFWQFNDVWNCPSWSSVDFEGVPKALQYKAKEFFAPVTVSCKKGKGKAVIFAHNDTLKKVSFKLNVKLFNGSKAQESTYDIEVEPNSFKEIDTVSVNKKTVLQLCFNGEVITEIFTAPVNLGLKKAQIDAKVDGNKMTLKSDTFAYNVFVECDAVADENYFCLAKGEEKTITFDKEPKDFKITCANNIEYKKSDVKKKLFRLFYRLEPLNIGNYFYYTYN